jgi:predicted Fe-S protein YdhL (DUF1289 family)
MTQVQDLWEQLLSREDEKIIDAWNSLADNEQGAVWIHLIRMTTEEGWAEPQRVSAAKALNALRAHGINR